MSGIVFLIAFLVLVAGSVIAYLLVKARLEGRARSELMAEKEARVSADVRYQEAEKNLIEQKNGLKPRSRD